MNALDFPTIEWGDSQGLVDAIEASTDLIPKERLGEIHAPFRELVCTPMTARACALGQHAGRDFFHHEGRFALSTPEHFQPEIEVDPGGCDPRWSFGVFTAPKYFSFFQDAPFAAYHPNHRVKWRAHEMLHGAARFFWRSDMSRFEAYIGARLNELVPVAHWYHFDEIARERCPDHRQRIPKQWCPHCENIGAYWDASVTRTEDWVNHADAGFAHVDTEIGACRREMESGEVVETFLALGLNSSTDATGYMRAHWNRLTTYAFGRWIEMFMEPQRDYFSRVAEYADHVQQVARQLVSGTVAPAPSEARQRRRAQDLAYRVMWWCESQEDPDQWEDKTSDAMEKLSTSMDDIGCDAFFSELNALVDPNVFVLGWELHSEQQIHAGLVSVSDDSPIEDVDEFSRSETFWERGTIAERYDRFLTDRGDNRWRVPASVCALPRVDLDGERFAAVPETVVMLKRGRLRINDTVRRIDELSIGYHFYGSFRVVAWSDPVARIFDAIDDEGADLESLDIPTLMELIETGCVLWFPEVV